MKRKRQNFPWIFLCVIFMVPFILKCESDNPPVSGTAGNEYIYNEENVFNINEVSQRPKLLNKPSRVYPEKALEEKIEGTVQVYVVIDEKGDVIDVKIDERMSVPLLNEDALATAKIYKFSPALKNETPVKVRMLIPFTYDLDFADPAKAKTANLYQFYAVTDKPRMIHKEAPVYPEKAKKDGIEGMVVLTITIDENGSVEKTKVYGNTSNNPELENAAIEASKKCKFEPAKLDGIPVKVKMSIPYRFKL